MRAGTTNPQSRIPNPQSPVPDPQALIRRFAAALGIALVAVLTAPAAARAQPSAASSKPPAWRAPDVDSVRAAVLAWLEQSKPNESKRRQAQAIWSGALAGLAGPELLARTARTIALADANAQKLLELCSKPRGDPVLPSHAWLADPKQPPLVANNLRLLYGLWLVRQSMFDEAEEQLGALKPPDVVDPASLLFYQAVVYHQLLRREPGLEAIGQLLDAAEQCPKRYVAVAKMMQEDLKGLKEDTLDHIARRMEDIRRRLDLGRAGKKVLDVEDGVIASLDKLIKQLEDQQKRQQAQGAGGSMRPSSPAPDSQILGGKGPGEVDKKKIGSKSGWGDLPPRQREEALQQIGREFPPHYRDLIEQYFRRLASEENE